MSKNYPFTKNLLFYSFLFSSTFLFSGCGMRFYKSYEISSGNFDEKINVSIKAKKYFIIHLGEKQWHLENPTIVNENEQVHMKGKLEHVGSLEAKMSKRLASEKSEGKKLAYSPRFGKKNTASHQIHLYVFDSEINENEFSVPLSMITKVVNYNTAPAITLVSHFILTFVLPSTIISFIFR